MVKQQKGILKLVLMAMLVALGVVISPFLRFEGMCPMAHFINIVCSVLLGPWYALLCAALIGVIRMTVLGIPPIALTGAVFGAFLSGVFYKASKGKILMAVLGEVIGTGIIGAVLSYPVMTLFWGKEGLSWLFYVPSFICGTLIGGFIAFAFLKKLSNSGMLQKFQSKLCRESYQDNSGVLGNAISVAVLGLICYILPGILENMLKWKLPEGIHITANVFTVVFGVAAIAYYIIKKVKCFANKS